MIKSYLIKGGKQLPLQKKSNETIYQGRDVWVNQRTGETIEADQVVKKYLEMALKLLI